MGQLVQRKLYLTHLTVFRRPGKCSVIFVNRRWWDLIPLINRVRDPYCVTDREFSASIYGPNSSHLGLKIQEKRGSVTSVRIKKARFVSYLLHLHCMSNVLGNDSSSGGMDPNPRRKEKKVNLKSLLSRENVFVHNLKYEKVLNFYFYSPINDETV